MKHALVSLKNYLDIYIGGINNEYSIAIYPLISLAKNTMEIIINKNIFPSQIITMAIPLKNHLESILSNLDKSVRKPLRLYVQTPTALPEYTPNIKENYTLSHKRYKSATNKEQEELLKLKRKKRSELRGAQRELKQDAMFIARQKLEKQKQIKEENDLKRKEVRKFVNTLTKKHLI